MEWVLGNNMRGERSDILQCEYRPLVKTIDIPRYLHILVHRPTLDMSDRDGENDTQWTITSPTHYISQKINGVHSGLQHGWSLLSTLSCKHRLHKSIYSLPYVLEILQVRQNSYEHQWLQTTSCTPPQYFLSIPLQSNNGSYPLHTRA